MADKFMLNKDHLNDKRYGFYGFERKTGQQGNLYLMIYTSPSNKRNRSYPHLTIYYQKLKDKTKELVIPEGNSVVISQGQYFHITMSEYHFSRDESTKYGRKYKDGGWSWMDMGANIGRDEVLKICEQFERLLERKIKAKERESDSAWNDTSPDNERFPNQKHDPVYEKDPAPVNHGSVEESWENIKFGDT